MWAQGQGLRLQVPTRYSVRAVQFCHISRTRGGRVWPSGLRWHATLDRKRTLCGVPVPQPQQVGRTHDVRWHDGLGVVRCQRCRSQLLGDLWVEAPNEAGLRLAEQVLLLGLDLPLLGCELAEASTSALPDDSGWPSLNSGAFKLAAIVHVADTVDCTIVHVALRQRLTDLLADRLRGTVNLCVRHSTPDDDTVEAAWRLGEGSGQ